MLERDLAVLGLKPGVEASEIRRAYRILAKKYHPDLSGMNSDVMFDRVTHAYKNLTVRPYSSRVFKYPVRETGKKRYEKPVSMTDQVKQAGNILLKGTSAEQRAFAAKKLGNSGKKAAFYYLKHGLTDNNPLVVRSSVEAIGRLKVYQSAGDLSTAFSRGGTEIRMEVLKAVEAIGVVGGFKNIVLQAMKDASSKVRMKGISMFAEEVNDRRRHG
jgi:curved DNA-binding protein CbpA